MAKEFQGSPGSSGQTGSKHSTLKELSEALVIPRSHPTSQISKAKNWVKYKEWPSHVLQECERRLAGLPDFECKDVATLACVEEPLDEQGSKVDGVYELSDEGPDMPQPLNEWKRILRRFDEQTEAAAEKTEEVNLYTEENPKQILVSASLSTKEKEDIVKILKELMSSLGLTRTCPA